jgi:branched-chain amino acid transport system substrate-binding protein
MVSAFSVRRATRHTAVLACAVLVLTGCGNAYSTQELLEAQGRGPALAAQDQSSVGTNTLPGAPAAVGAQVGPTAVASEHLGAVGTKGDKPADRSGKKPTSTGIGAAGTTGATPAAQTGTGPIVAATGVAAPTCTTSGVPLVLGQVGAWSGLVGQSAGNGRTGLAVWANYVNAHGGLACHLVRLTSIDDQSDGAKSAAAVNDLVQNKKAQALVGSFVPIAASAYRAAVEQNKVPTIGGDYVSEAWLESPYLYPVGGSPEAVYTAAMKGAVGLGKRTFANFYCVEAAACAYGNEIAQKNAGAAGGKIVYTTGVSLTQSDFTAQCQNARKANVDAINYFGDGSSVQRIARSCNNLGYNPLLMIGALAAIDPLRTDPNANKGGLLFAPNVFPWMLAASPAQQEFQSAYKRYAPGTPTDAAAALAWTSGKMLEAAVAALGSAAVSEPITTDLIMKGLGKITKETLGGLIPATTYSFHQARATPVDCAYVAVLSDRVWRAQFAGKPQCL